MAAIAAGIGLGTVAGIFNGVKNCDASDKNKCYPRYVSDSSGECAGDTGGACLGSDDGMILPTDENGYGTTNDQGYPNTVFQVGNGNNTPDENKNQIMLNPNYLSACYSEEIAKEKKCKGIGEEDCKNDCQWEPGYNQNGQPQDGKCVKRTQSNLFFITGADGKVDTNVLPQYEATDRCWYNDNPTSADCAKVDESGIIKKGAGSRVALDSALCQNKTVCINNNVIPNPFKECDVKDAANNNECSFYVKDTPCEVGADVENNGCIKDYSCRSGYINQGNRYTADAPQPWMKYISRPKCDFVTPQPSNSTNGWKTFGAALAGMAGFNVDGPLDKAKDSLQAAQDSINSITAKNSIAASEEGLKDLKVFRQSLQVQQKELLMLSSNATEMLSWKVEKNTLYFNLIAIVVCVLILFELI
jgi:hypothetical protein